MSRLCYCANTVNIQNNKFMFHSLDYHRGIHFRRYCEFAMLEDDQNEINEIIN